MTVKHTLFVCGYLTALCMAAWLVVILKNNGAWLPTTQPQRITYLGQALLAFIGIAALYGLGVLLHKGLQALKLKFGPVEIGVNEDSDDKPTA